ncbi:hypothetical protein DOTSEDRAFT_70358 [Dothistroma septosporum NZE10]|uniref:Uncharacterized protein n=1 Tax=Dothistroma septosporum (strain NZE10 / CBS 128990) TaxID=675120 RepID=N1PTQ2_DOTSN|nr:hypothetical protein DOTSEDRAFT_70358 [Dothistroma septosporum NZE10]
MLLDELREQRSSIYSSKAICQAPTLRLSLHAYVLQSQVRPVQQNPEGEQHDCLGEATPACIQELYGMPAHPPKSMIDNTTSGSIAFTNFLDQVPRYDDLEASQVQ